MIDGEDGIADDLYECAVELFGFTKTSFVYPRTRRSRKICHRPSQRQFRTSQSSKAGGHLRCFARERVASLPYFQPTNCARTCRCPKLQRLEQKNRGCRIQGSISPKIVKPLNDLAQLRQVTSVTLLLRHSSNYSSVRTMHVWWAQRKRAAVLGGNLLDGSRDKCAH